jgi:hypothetical protein
MAGAARVYETGRGAADGTLALRRPPRWRIDRGATRLHLQIPLLQARGGKFSAAITSSRYFGSWRSARTTSLGDSAVSVVTFSRR